MRKTLCKINHLVSFSPSNYNVLPASLDGTVGQLSAPLHTNIHGCSAKLDDLCQFREVKIKQLNVIMPYILALLKGSQAGRHNNTPLKYGRSKEIKNGITQKIIRL